MGIAESMTEELIFFSKKTGTTILIKGRNIPQKIGVYTLRYVRTTGGEQILEVYSRGKLIKTIENPPMSSLPIY